MHFFACSCRRATKYTLVKLDDVHKELDKALLGRRNRNILALAVAKHSFRAHHAIELVEGLRMEHVIDLCCIWDTLDTEMTTTISTPDLTLDTETTTTISIPDLRPVKFQALKVRYVLKIRFTLNNKGGKNWDLLDVAEASYVDLAGKDKVETFDFQIFELWRNMTKTKRVYGTDAATILKKVNLKTLIESSLVKGKSDPFGIPVGKYGSPRFVEARKVNPQIVAQGDYKYGAIISIN